METKKNVLWKLFISTLYLSAFTSGGGYVIVTLMKKKFVNDIKLNRRGRNAGSRGYRPVRARTHRGKRRHRRGL
ncbi:MAG: hypothetical protein V8Q40_11905 [Anaerosacchariphilus sp.]